MAELKIILDDGLAKQLAIDKGWQEQIEDMGAEMEGDNYPLINNPVSFIEYLEDITPKIVEEKIIKEGREFIHKNFESIMNGVQATIDTGVFDDLIKNDDYLAIKEAIKDKIGEI